MEEKYIIKFEFSTGKSATLCLETKYAPKTVEHFVGLVEKGVLDGTMFHRVIENFMIQGGGYKVVDNSLTELEGIDNVVGEFNSNGFENNLKHELGVISMARTSEKNSATSQFFLCSATCPWLDGEYAAFGYCVDEESKEAILEISKVETGTFYYFQDFPMELITINKVSLLK